MQHIVIQTANSEPLLHEDGWAFNGIGRKFSHKVSVFLEGLFLNIKILPESRHVSFNRKVADLQIQEHIHFKQRLVIFITARGIAI